MNNNDNKFTGYIYKIYNDIDDKVYIGQTRRSIKKRWMEHKNDAKKKDTYLYQKMREYGVEHFNIKELYKVVCNSKIELMKKLDELEILEIKKHKSRSHKYGFNLSSGGNNKQGRTTCYRPVCQYDIYLHLIKKYDCISDAEENTGIPASNIIKGCNNSECVIGGFIWCYSNKKPQTPSFMINRHSDNIVTSGEEAKRLIRLFKLNVEDKRIIQYNGLGEVLNIYNDIIDASKKLNAPINELRKNINGENLQYKKTVLRYEGDAFDKYPPSYLMQAIDVYDVYGNFIKSYESIGDARNELNLNSSVGRYMRLGNGACGYLFTPHGKPLERKSKNVFTFSYEMYDDDMNLINTFHSLNDVGKYLRVSLGSTEPFDKASKEHIKYKGYYWRLLKGMPSINQLKK